MGFKKNGFSLTESIITLIIIGFVVIFMAPIMIKRNQIATVQAKLHCIPGARYVVANNNLCGNNEVNKIELPPGINSFYVTMTGGGGGGGSACVYQDSGKRSRGHSACNDGGAGGGAGAYILKRKVTFDLAKTESHAIVDYTLGAGGCGGPTTGGDNAYPMGMGGHAAGGGGQGGTASDFKIIVGSTTKRFNIENINSGTTNNLTKAVVNGGGGASAFSLRGIRSTYNIGIINIDAPDNFAYGGAAGGGNAYAYSGQAGQSTRAAHFGFGGASAMGYGSYGSGGGGGMEAIERNMNIKRGELQGYRRRGEDGLGGIMIIEFDTKCQ